MGATLVRVKVWDVGLGGGCRSHVGGARRCLVIAVLSPVAKIGEHVVAVAAWRMPPRGPERIGACEGAGPISARP